jgi:guanosine-3',5'-bis(diphosphate) 3'-pyrophosphohydrolase
MAILKPSHGRKLTLQYQFETALGIALSAHKGQVDLSGAAYILHVLRVIEGVRGLSLKIVAALHDVLEDSEITADDLLDHGFPGNIVTAVCVLTRRETESYEDYIERVSEDPLAKHVKLADLRDNMRIEDMPLTPSGFDRFRKYQKAIQFLKSKKKEQG